MRAYHFLQADMRSFYGDEGPWTIGETRQVTGDVILCEHGYHWSPSWLDALYYANGPIACIVKVADGELMGNQGVSQWRQLVAARDVSRELRLLACECAERALHRDRKYSREPSSLLWDVIAVARRFAIREATDEELAEARDAVRMMAWDKVQHETIDVARNTVFDAVGKVVWITTRHACIDATMNASLEAEISWQHQRLAELIDPLFAGVEA